MTCLQRPKASAQKPESVLGKHDAWMQHLQRPLCVRMDARAVVRPYGARPLQHRSALSSEPSDLLGVYNGAWLLPVLSTNGTDGKGARGECQPQHRPENRNRFSESTMRRFNNLQRPQCVRMDARRCSAGRAKRWRPARILVRGGLGSLGQGQPPSSMMVGSRRAPV